MKIFINWLTAPVYIEHKNVNTKINKGWNERIKVNAVNCNRVLADANRYHHNWSIVTRLHSWFK